MAYERKKHDSFILHADQLSMICALSDSQAGILIRCLGKRKLGKEYETDEMEPMTHALFEMISNQHDREDAHFAEVCEARRVVRKPVETKVNLSQQKYVEKDKENEKEKENDKVFPQDISSDSSLVRIQMVSRKEKKT